MPSWAVLRHSSIMGRISAIAGSRRVGALIAGLFALVLGCATASAGVARASIPPGEWKRPLSDIGAESPAVQAKELSFLLYCLAAVTAGRTKEAVSACSDAITLDPSNPAGYKLRGIAYWSSSELSPALVDLNRAATLDPRDAETQGTMGAVFRARHQTSQSVKAYSRAIALDPLSSRWWNGRCWTRAVARMELKVALADCTKAIALNPHSYVCYDSRGLVYLQLGRARDAERDYSNALMRDPNVASSLFGRGVAKLWLRDQTAERDFARAMSLDAAIARTFAGYGIVVDAAYLQRPPRAPEKRCSGQICPATPAVPKKSRPAPGNDTVPVRAAQR